MDRWNTQVVFTFFTYRGKLLINNISLLETYCFLSDKIMLSNGFIGKHKECECGKNYIGITERKIATRVSEHKRSVKNFDTNNAIAVHCRQDCDKKMLWNDVKIIAKEKTTRRCCCC